MLTGRVWVYQRNGAPAVAYFRADGAFHNCSLRWDKTGYRFSGAGWEWRIGTRRNKAALQVTVHPGIRVVVGSGFDEAHLVRVLRGVRSAS